MKKIIFLTIISLCISCEKDEFEDKINEYKNKPKSEDLKGFWQLKGFINRKTMKIQTKFH